MWAKLCDACGKAFTLESYKKPNRVTFAFMYENRTIKTMKELDICPECADEIGALLDSKEKKKEEK